jgi:hypothetical protein
LWQTLLRSILLVVFTVCGFFTFQYAAKLILHFYSVRIFYIAMYSKAYYTFLHGFAVLQGTYIVGNAVCINGAGLYEKSEYKKKTN